MTIQNHHQPLFDTISEIIRNELEIDATIESFIRTACSEPDIERILDDPDHPERDMVLELIFFPGETMQMRIEKTLEHTGRIRRLDEQRIAGDIAAAFPHVDLRRRETGGKLRIKVPSDIWAGFIARFNLTHVIDPEVARAIKAHIPAEFAHSVKIILRNGNISYTPGRVDFLLRIMSNTDRDIDNQMNLIKYAAGFIQSVSDSKSIEEALEDRKQALLHQLQRLSDISRRMKTYTMETLMMEGTRLPARSSETLMTEIAMIDRIIYCCGFSGI